MRNNGGGFFPAGVDVAKMLLAGGDIVLIADSQGVRDSYEADGTAVDAKSQLAVLVNRGTASASEVGLYTVVIWLKHLLASTAKKRPGIAWRLGHGFLPPTSCSSGGKEKKASGSPAFSSERTLW